MKRFVAANMQQALRQIREEMGSEAVILSTRKLTSGIEVVGALNYSEDELAQDLSEQAQASANAQFAGAEVATVQFSRQRQAKPAKTGIRNKFRTGKEQHNPDPQQHSGDCGSAHVDSANPGKPGSIDGVTQADTRREIAELKEELLALRSAIEHQADTAASGQRDFSALLSKLHTPGGISELQQTQPEATTDIKQRVRALGILPELEQQLFAASAGGENSAPVWRNLLAKLSQDLLTEDQELIDKEGCFALLGPTGVGKTTTIAKLAARFVLKYGAQKIALVTTDRFRVAASQHLQSFGRLLNVPVLLVDDKQSLDDVLDRLSDKRLVLVDTAGLHPADANWQLQCRDLQVERHQLCNYLLISTVTQAPVIKALCHHYRSLNLAGCILTRVDEACSLGEAISMAILQKLPVAYFTDGQHIPLHLQHAQADELIKRAISLARASKGEAALHGSLTA